jgi:uncharacterized protein YhaN
MSIGAREQLSTLFRLCLAERLGTALLLDDQLVQSDPDRLRWFRGALYESAAKIQIVVLTCRRDDYVDAKSDLRAVNVVDLGAMLLIDSAARRTAT